MPLIRALEAQCSKASNLLRLPRWVSALGFSLKKTKGNDHIK